MIPSRKVGAATAAAALAQLLAAKVGWFADVEAPVTVLFVFAAGYYMPDKSEAKATDA